LYRHSRAGTINLLRSRVKNGSEVNIPGCLTFSRLNSIQLKWHIRLQTDLYNAISLFRDTDIVPKLAECVHPGFAWEDSAEQACVIVVQVIASLKDQRSEEVVRTYVIPILQTFRKQRIR
jgi:hypothetical protein